MKTFSLILIFFFLSQNIGSSLTNEKLYRLKYKAKTETAKTAIQKYCSKEDPGLEIDSEVGEKLMFSKSCKCAINSGNFTKVSKVNEILRTCKF